jgi:hypothetical protein
MTSVFAGVSAPHAGEKVMSVVGPVDVGVLAVTVYVVTLFTVLTVKRAPTGTRFVVSVFNTGERILAVVSVAPGVASLIVADPLSPS